MGLRTAMGSDGRVHLESAIGCVRRDLTDGTTSHVISGGGDGYGIDTAIGEGGRVSHELRLGNLRVRRPGNDTRRVI